MDFLFRHIVYTLEDKNYRGVMPSYPIHATQHKQAVISLGGSLIVPNEIDSAYLAKFRKFIQDQLQEGWTFFIVTGGGAPARKYIEAARDVLNNELTKDDMDWLGIHATRMNAHLVRTLFRNEAQPSIITDPEIDEVDETKIVVVSGWKPGWSTDFVGTMMAKRFQIPYVINLSNIKQVFTADPKKDPTAKPIDVMKWSDYRAMVGDEWTPGLNTPFDPIAARMADENNLTVLVMDGSNLDNLKKAMTEGEFVGTVLTNTP